MSATYLNIEVDAGSHITECAREALYIANQIGIDVTFDFNDVHCIMGPGEHPDILVQNYEIESRSNKLHKIANAWVVNDTP